MKTFIILFLFLSSALMIAKENIIQLPTPQQNIGKSLMESLALRHSSREFAPDAISLQEISNLLWAAFGYNRPEDKKRTAPSAMNTQEMDIYLVMKDASYLWNPESNTLKLITDGDIREYTGGQDFVKTAPLNIIYVADLSKIKRDMNDDMKYMLGADAAFIAENVYLYCASQGLNVVVRASIPKDKLSEKLKLADNQKIILGQTIGYPPKSGK